MTKVISGRRIPRTMSTQHPDNARIPFFADGPVLGGEDEIKEAFYAFSHIQSREQLWDFEGKEVDNHVVRKLLTRYDSFFSRNRLGRDFFLTLRVPNPEIEKNEAKILIETLDSIPRSYDVAKMFYGPDGDVPPIFEVSQPMTTNSASLVRIREYYRKIVVGKESTSLVSRDMPIKSWIGEFYPKDINVIPLVEDMPSILNSHNIVREYLETMGHDKPEYQRVWLARSDPALNYGSLAAVLVNKIALRRLEVLENELSIPIFPILGTGSVPFRGNMKPTNAESITKAYPSVQTFTIQSAFKYDYPEQMVFDSVKALEESTRGRATQIDDEEALILIANKLSARYQKETDLIAGMVNDFAPFIPQRRKRKLHIGLFGYSRSVNKIRLPRAIGFCASLYSMGLPPETLGLSVLTERELELLHGTATFIDSDMADSLQYLNTETLRYFPKEIQKSVLKVSNMFEYETNEKHQRITSIIMDDYSKRNTGSMEENIIRAGSVRGFLG